MKKRILCVLLALLLAVSLLPAGALAADGGEGESPASASVDLTVQRGGAFTLVALDEPVSAGLSDAYGLTDAVADGVSALDVLLRAHEKLLGEAFTAETVGDYLALGETGFLTKVFGEKTSNVGFTVNGALAHDGVLKDDEYAPGGKSYTGYAITQAKIETGDLMEFFFYQDGYCLDNYPRLTRGDAAVTEIAAKPGSSVALTVEGYCFAYYGYVPMEALTGLFEPLDGAKLAWVGADGSLTDAAAVGEDGAAALPVPETEGSYLLTVYMPADEIKDHYATPVIMPLLRVTADKNAAEPTEPQYGPCDLTALAAADFDSNPNALTLTPVFSADVTDYRTPEVAYKSSEYLCMAYVKATAADSKATITAACNGVSAGVTSGGSWAFLAKALKPGQDNLLTVTVENSGESKTYNITIPMAADPATLGTLTLSGCHDAQVKYLKLFACGDDGEKTGEDRLAGQTLADGAYAPLRLPAGDWWVEGYDANGDCNGALRLTVEAGKSAAYKLQRIYRITTNSGWVLGEDYTMSVTVRSADGEARHIRTGTATNWGTTAPSCIFAVGDTVTVRITPDAEKRPTFGEAEVSKTPNMNDDISASCKEFAEVTFTAPEGAEIAVGKLARSYVYTVQEPYAAPVTEDGTVRATYRLDKGTTYFYRVRHPEGVTYWNFKSWSAAGTESVSAEDLHIGDGAYTKSTVLDDFSLNVHDVGNIYLNINAQGWKTMEVGETFELNVFRNWQAIEGFMNSKIAIPDAHYTVLSPEGGESDVVTVTPDAFNSCVANMTANRAGTAIVLVTYDAMTHAQGQSSTASKFFSATWPELTGVFVVTVGEGGEIETKEIKTNMVLDRLDAAVSSDTQRALDAEHDMLFYTGSEGASYSFAPETGCTVTVARGTAESGALTFGAFTAEGVSRDADGVVTVSGLTTGRHIIRVEKDGKAAYQVVTARGVSYVLTDADGKALTGEVKAGDTVYLQFTGLLNPQEKLATAYNFNFSLRYAGEDGTYFRSNPGGNFGIYDFSGNPVRQRIAVTIPKYWAEESYSLHGALQKGGNSGVPSHRSIRYATGNDPQLSAPAASGVLSRLPDVTLVLAPTQFLTGTLTFNGGAVARSGLTVTLADADGNNIAVADDGSFSALAEEYFYTVRGAGFAYATGSVTLTEGGENRFDIALTAIDSGAWDGATQTEPALLDGVYQIATGAHLAWFTARSADADVSGVLTADIALADYPWLNVSSSRAVTLRGEGHEITGLNAQSGLFAKLGANSAISDLTLRGKSAAGGAVAGELGSGGSIERCLSYVEISGSGTRVGGIVGSLGGNAAVRDAASFGAVAGKSEVGGIVGAFTGSGSTVTGCYSTGAVSASAGSAGGVFGASGYGVTVAGCYSTGSVSGSTAGGVGGTVKGETSWRGELLAAITVRDCYSTGEPAFGSTDSGSALISTCFAGEAARGAALDEAYFAPVCGSEHLALRWQKDVTFHTRTNGAVTAPTCTEPGYTEYTCENCETAYRAEHTAALGHALGETKRVYPAYEAGDCVRCGTPLKVWNDPRLEHFTLPEENAENITMADAAGSIPWAYNAEKSRFESGNRGKNNTVSETSLTFTLPYGGTLRFDWGVSSEKDYDKATTALGGTKIADAVSGEKTGSFDTTLAAGTYTLTLSYAKDSASSDGEDLAYVRSLTLTAFAAGEYDDLAAAKAVDEKIAAIGSPVTLASEDAIRAARVSFDLLSAAQKALVENYAGLTAAERALAALKKAEHPAEDEITVTFRLIGADKSAEDVDLGTGTGSSVYRTWIATRSYTLPAGSTVGDLFLRALADAGLRQSGAEDGYVSAIWAPAALGGYRLGDMDNGSRSGWMYMVNGSHPGLGLNARLLADKDAVVWHYVNDYAYEVRDWFADEDYPALGDESTWVDWSAVPDFDPVADDDGETKPETPAAFADVAESDWFHDAAYWAAAQGITQGQGSADTFAPRAACTRAEIVTMLWRAAGSPAPKGTETPFADISPEDWFYAAALWAYETGVARGWGSAARFAPEEACIRGEAATFLCRALGEADAEPGTAFSDVAPGAYYAASVNWAAATGVTKGVGGGRFAPQLGCTRAEIVTMLYRLLGQK